MIIEINNFGTIDHLRIDTSKNLSLIYGMNGIGKSYAVACVYCVLKSWEEVKKMIPLTILINDTEDSNMVKENFIIAYLKKCFIDNFEKSFYDRIQLKNCLKKQDIFIDIFIENAFKLRINFIENINFEFIFFEKFISDVDFLKKENKIYFLPSGRSGLYQGLNSFAPILAKFSLLPRGSQAMELPSLSLSISDYFIQLSTVKTSHTNPKYQPIIQKFEQKILKGEIRYDEQTRKMQYLPEGLGISLDVQQSASMVAELSSLLVFFKHVLKDTEENIIFIEEPEAHLHPATQIALMEILDEFAKAGVKIFLTSHSNYMFNKLGNMLLAGTTNPETVGVYHLVMTPTGSVQNMNMQASKEGIEDDNFTNVAEQLYNERLKIYEQNEPN